MLGSRVPLVGREDELAVVSQFIADATSGSAGLVLEGAAGIGKTALWNAAISAARDGGTLVWTCRCSESDSAWAFAGLGDLLDGLSADVIEALPAVQQRALAAALLLADSPAAAPGDRVVGVAVLEVMRAVARTRPLVLAVDDIQWLDLSSAKVLSFALRRLRDEPVRLIASRRTGATAGSNTEESLGLSSERVAVGPVSIGSLQRIVQSHLSGSLSRPTLTRVHRATGGNPMMGLEMARALQQRGHEPAPDEPLPVPADLRVLVTQRLSRLRPDARRLLLISGALAQPTVAVVTAAMEDTDVAAAALDEALSAGVLELDGERVHFTHPLISSIPYEDLAPDARRALHRLLAQVVPDPEEHARHWALGSPDPSVDLAAALDVASRRARRRGTLDAAIELAALAVSRTPVSDTEDLLRRGVDLAELVFRLGEPARAQQVLADAMAATRPGPHRVRGLLLAATIASWEQGDANVAEKCEQALAEAGDDLLLQARCHATWADTSPSGAAMDLVHAQTAVQILETLVDPPSDLLANALTNVALHGVRLGHGLTAGTLERAVELEAQGEPPPIMDRAGMGMAMCLKLVDRFDESRAWLHAMETAAVQEGEDSVLPHALGHLAMLECWAGEYELALQYAESGREHAARIGFRAPTLHSAHVLVLVHLGRLDEARALAESDLAADEPLGYLTATALHLRSLGLAVLAAGDPATAASHLLRSWAISQEFGVGEPAILRLHGDAVVALVAVGRIEDAQRMTAELDAHAALNGLPWATAMAGRCHGLLSVEAGDLPGALAFLEQAMVDHLLLPMPFEQARTRLLLGSVLRRAGRRNDARRELAAALVVFVRLGTGVQADQARAELASIGGRRGSESELTAVEERIAGLVGAGKTNKEVAGALFMSVRTVESHLGRVYRKLGIRSRTELARRV